MSFVLCPECGAPCSDLAISCPRCGFPLGYVTDRRRLERISFNPFTEFEGYPDQIEALCHERDDCTTPETLVAEAPSLPAGILLTLCGSRDAKTRELVARNPTLPPDLLDSLAKDEDWKVRKAVASNPATSVDTLAALAYCLESPNYPSGSHFDRNHIIDLRLAVANNPSIDTGLMARLAADYDARVRAAIASRQDAGQDVLTLLSKDASVVYTESEGSISIRSLVARNPSLGEETLATLANEQDRDVRVSVASNPSASEGLLSRLAHDGDWRVKEAVAQNPSAAESLLTDMALDFSYDLIDSIRAQIARNPSATIEVFHALRKKDAGFSLESYSRYAPSDNRIRPAPAPSRVNGYMLERIAENPSVGPDTLRQFSEDEDPVFRVIAAGHVLTPDVLLLRLAEDQSKPVRMAVATNDGVPSSVAKVLAKDPDADVRATFACGRSPYLGLLLGDADESVLEHLARNTAASRCVLGRLSKHTSVSLRCAVAENSSCPQDVIAQLCEDESDEVRCCLARNPSTPYAVLYWLARDRSLEVRIAVAKRNDEQMDTLFEHLASLDGPRALLAALYGNPRIPKDMRARLGEHLFGPYYDYNWDDSDSSSSWEDSQESPLAGWHYDEDNGWLDYYPEDGTFDHH